MPGTELLTTVKVPRDGRCLFYCVAISFNVMKKHWQSCGRTDFGMANNEDEASTGLKLAKIWAEPWERHVAVHGDEDKANAIRTDGCLQTADDLGEIAAALKIHIKVSPHTLVMVPT
jgi:hypothetical protein